MATNKYYTVQYFSVDLTPRATHRQADERRSRSTGQSFKGVARRHSAPHVQHPASTTTNNQGMTALKTFYDARRRRAVTAGNCGTDEARPARAVILATSSSIPQKGAQAVRAPFVFSAILSKATMTKLVGGDGRTHIESRLMRESLQDRKVLVEDRQRARPPDLPRCLAGLDRRAEHLRPRQGRDPAARRRARRGQAASHKMVIGVGGGTRVRHTISIALDLGLPTGGIAQLVGAMEELNAILLNALLAQHGSMPMQRDHFWDLPLYFDAGITPIAICVPPYHFWEPPPERGRAADARLGLRPVPARRGARHEAGHLRQGRGRPLRQGSEAARGRQAVSARSRSTS